MLFLVRQFKQRSRAEKKKFLKVLAQVLCELFAIWRLNRRQNTDIDPSMLTPVYACLDDAVDAYFLSYDGNCFRRRIFRNTVAPACGVQHVQGYIYATLKVHKYTFALLLEGYYNTLILHYERSVKVGAPVDVGSRESSPPMCRAPGTAKGWYHVCQLAYESRALFQRAHQVNSNEPAERGLKLLYESLEAWPPVAHGGIQLRVMLPATVKALTESVIQRHERTLSADPNPTWEPKFPGVISVTVQERRKHAVDTFWRSLPANFRLFFEPAMLFKGDSFIGLSLAASDPRSHEKAFEKLGPGYVVEEFLVHLEVSNREGHWVMEWDME
ncbi:hypothetical protein B0H11DRAFT_2095390 [Mycena galericulata]|nr:hypothetical protein B0H11DRAFT_2095390 [Mycena galericulata]